MADDLTTVLRFEGDSASAESAIAGLIASLQRAATQTSALFSSITDSVAKLGQGAGANSLAEPLERIKPAATGGRDAVLSLAQATARLQVAEGNAAGAVETLKTALENAEKGTVAAIRAQTQLVAIEAQLANSAGKAETAMLREAQAVARLQQIAGNTPAAIKTLSDALDKASNRSSLPALRAELQKTYLDTNYANSPLVGMLQQINSGLGFLRPLLGSNAGLLQQLTGFATQAAQGLNNTKASVDANAKSASAFLDRIKQVNQAIVNFGKDQGGSASATDFFLNLQKAASVAADRIRETFARIKDSLANAFSKGGPDVTGLNLGKITQEASKLTPALSGVAAEGEAAAGSLGGLGAAGGASAIALGAVAVVVLAVVAAVAAFVAISVAAISGLEAIGEAGIKTNAQLETMRLGVATVIASVAELRNSDGVQLKGIDALNAAIPIAADQMRKLRIDALETSATIADIAPAFQAAIGPGLVAGLTIDQIRENTIKLTQAVTALGLPMDQIKQETRAILSGDINRNTQSAIALGITREAVKEAQKQGKFAEFLEQKLSAAAAAGQLVAKTFAAAQSNLKEAGDTFQAVVTEGLFNQIRDKANAILPQIFDKNSANLISKNFEGIGDTLTRIFDTAGQTINRVIDFIFNGLKQISGFLDQNRATVGEIIEAVNQVVVLIGETIAGIVQIATGAADTGRELDVVASFMKAIVVVVGLIGDGIKIWLSATLTVGNAIKLAIVAPLEVAVKLLAAFLSGIPFAGEAANNAARALESARKSATTGIVESSKNFVNSIANIGQASAKSIKQIEEARKRAAAGQRAVAGVESEQPTATGATIRPPKRPPDKDKGAAARARQEAAAELKLLQLQEKQAELINKRVDNGLRQSLADRLISLETFTELAIRNDQELLDKRLAALDAEEKAAVRTAKNATEAEAKRAEFKLKAETLQQDFDIKQEAVRDDLRRADEKAEEDHQNRLAAIREAARKAVENTIRASLTSGLLSNTQAEEKLIEAERERFAEREGLLNANLELARKDVAKRQEIQDQLAQLAVERAAFEEEASRRIADAQKKEAEGFFDLLRKRIKALADLRRAQIEAQAAQVGLAVQRGTLTKAQAEQQEIQRRRELLQIESAERQQAIEKEAEQLKQQARNQAGAAAQIVEIEKNKNARLKAEKDRAEAEDKTLENQQRAVDLAPIFGQEAAERIAATEQILGGAVGVLDQLRIAAQATADSLLVSMPTIGQVFAQSALAIADSTAAILASFISGQAPIRKAAAALYAAALEPLKKYLLKKASAEFALAVADFAIGNYAGGAKHTLAGVALTGAAALIDVGGALIGGSAGSAGAAGAAISGANNGPTTADTRSPISQDTPKPERTVIILRPEINLRGDIRKGVLEVVHDDINNNGRTRGLIQEVAPTG